MNAIITWVTASPLHWIPLAVILYLVIGILFAIQYVRNNGDTELGFFVALFWPIRLLYVIIYPILEHFEPRPPESGCFITTAVCKTLGRADDCDELIKFRHFRDTFMKATPETQAEIEEYYAIAPAICAKIDAQGEQKAAAKYAAIWENALKPAFQALQSGDNQKAHDLYKEMVLALKSEFLAG
jgi:hypothetical protein